MDSFRFSGLLPVVFGGCKRVQVVVGEVCGFTLGDAFADLEVACPDHERGLIIVVGVGGWFGRLPVG